MIYRSTSRSGDRAPVRALRPIKNNVKHLTGRFSSADVERVALLRARLNLDNSALLKRAVAELYERCINIKLEPELTETESLREM